MKLDHSSFGLRESEHFFWLWVLLTFLWIAANSSFAMESVASGALISAALAYIFTQKTNVWQGLRFSPSRFYYFILYTGVFAVELLRANINMMRYVYAPRHRYQARHRQDQDGLEDPRSAAWRLRIRLH